MRKAFSILFILVIMLSGAHFTIAIHYCGGKVAATKISLSGKLASCGMESTTESCPLPGKNLATHCCEDIITTVGIVNNFTQPDFFQINITQNNIQPFYSPVSQSFSFVTNSDHICTNTGPPGRFPASAVNLHDICAFRI
jgi:hypothetical protein